jgi:hypothetical protein
MDKGPCPLFLQVGHEAEVRRRVDLRALLSLLKATHFVCHCGRLEDRKVGVERAELGLTGRLPWASGRRWHLRPS